MQVASVANELMRGMNLTAMALIGGANPARQVERCDVVMDSATSLVDSGFPPEIFCRLISV